MTTVIINIIIITFTTAGRSMHRTLNVIRKKMCHNSFVHLSLQFQLWFFFFFTQNENTIIMHSLWFFTQSENTIIMHSLLAICNKLAKTIICIGINQADWAGLEKAPWWAKICSKSFQTRTCLDCCYIMFSTSLFVIPYSVLPARCGAQEPQRALYVICS